MFTYRFDVIFIPQKFTWTDFGRVYIPYIPPVATPLEPTPHTLSVEGAFGHVDVNAAHGPTKQIFWALL